MRRSGPTWTLDWGDERVAPAVGDVFRIVSPAGAVTGYGRVVAARAVRNRKPLPAPYVARYRLTFQRLASRPDEAVAWTLNSYQRKPRPVPTHDRDRFSPLI